MNEKSTLRKVANDYLTHTCPTCANKKIIKGYNDLKTCNSKLAKDWNFKRNGKLKPTQVSPNSNKKVWWKCSEGHEWIASINDRSRGNGCPFCYGKNISKATLDNL